MGKKVIDQSDEFEKLGEELRRLHEFGLLPAQAMPPRGWPAGQRIADVLAAKFEAPCFLTCLALAVLIWTAAYAAWG